MKNNCLVSVIIPVYNACSYITGTVNSVLHQSYNNLEIIIVDDGSTDESGRTCDELSQMDKRIRVIHQENRGVSAARNVGLDLMTGTAVAFLDSDDEYHPDYISNMVNTMILGDYDIVICRYTMHPTKGDLISTDGGIVYPSIEAGVYDRKDTLRALPEKRINNHLWNKLYKNELWKDIRLPEGHIFEDLDVTYRIFDRCQSVCVIDKTLYMRRTYHGSLTNSCKKRHVDDWIIACNHLETFVENNIPSIYTRNQLVKIKKTKFYKLIDYYVLCKRGIQDKELSKYLRKEITIMGKDVGVGNLDFRYKRLYWMICYAPLLLTVFYSVHGFSRLNWIKKT